MERNRSFFPNVYNEDWFFVLDAAKGLLAVATVEGTFWLLDQGRSASDGDLAHWREFLGKRKRFIEQVLGMVERTTGPESVERQRKAVVRLESIPHMRRMRWKRRRSLWPASRARPRAMTTATRTQVSSFMWDHPYPAGRVKEQFRVSYDPTGRGCGCQGMATGDVRAHGALASEGRRSEAVIGHGEGGAD